MKSGGGSSDGDAAVTIGVDSLVALQVGGSPSGVGGSAIALDVGRQRDFAQTLGDGGNRFVVWGDEADVHRAVVFFADDLAGKGAGGLAESGARAKLSAGFNEAAPSAVIGKRAKEEALYLAARGTLRAQAGRQHGGVVAEKDISSLEKLRQVRKAVMGNGVGGSIDDKEP